MLKYLALCTALSIAAIESAVHKARYLNMFLIPPLVVFVMQIKMWGGASRLP